MSQRARRMMVPRSRPSGTPPTPPTGKRWSLRAIALVCGVQLACAPGEPGGNPPAEGGTQSGTPAIDPAADSLAVVRIAERFDSLLVAGDSGAALGLLAPDAVILESGGMETRDEYRAHHLASDVEFVRAVRTTRDPVRAVVRGDVGWTSATSKSEGTFRGKRINSAGAALMVLGREPDGWRIRAIHWSSRDRKP